MESYLARLHQIRCFVFDVDGVLTNGKVIAMESGEQARSFLVKDGYAIELALKAGFHVAVISGGNQTGVRKRLEFLHVHPILLGVKEKVSQFQAMCAELNIQPSEVLYMGDDWPDFEVMQLAGIPACPADAVPEIKEIALYVSTSKGGEGCVRDVIEKVLKAQQRFHPGGKIGINN